LIRSANHSSYPRIGDNPLDQQIRSVRRALEAGRATDDDVRRTEDEVATLIVADQARAFIDIVTDGMVRWEGPLAHLAHHVDGLIPGPLRRWFDTNFYQRQVEVTGPLARRGPFLVHDFEVARQVAQRSPVKTVLPGPVTFSHLACDRHYRDRAALAGALTRILAEEVSALRAAGARCFQLDEPLLCRHPEDADLVAGTAAEVFAAAGPDDVTILSTYFGDLVPLAGRLDRLPGSHLGLDLCAGPGNWTLLGRLPARRGVALGLFDARTTLQEDAADVAAKLEPHRASLAGRDLIVGPNAGLELLPRDAAFDKLLHSRYLVEKLGAEWA
jgi:methionine synthase II (cobalamin-independent)